MVEVKNGTDMFLFEYAAYSSGLNSGYNSTVKHTNYNVNPFNIDQPAVLFEEDNTDNPNLKTLSILGPRPMHLYGFDDREYYSALTNYLRDTIKDFYNNDNVANVISGGSQGAAQIAFWATEKLVRLGYPINNIVYRPFEKQYDRWNTKGMFGVEEYNHMISCAEKVVDCSTNVFDAIAAYKKQDIAMINDADIILIIQHAHNKKEDSVESIRIERSLDSGKPTYLLENDITKVGGVLNCYFNLVLL